MGPAKNLKHVSIYLSPEQLAELNALKSATGAPLTELVRRAIVDYVRKHKGGEEPKKR